VLHYSFHCFLLPNSKYRAKPNLVSFIWKFNSFTLLSCAPVLQYIFYTLYYFFNMPHRLFQWSKFVTCGLINLFNKLFNRINLGSSWSNFHFKNILFSNNNTYIIDVFEHYVIMIRFEIIQVWILLIRNKT